MTLTKDYFLKRREEQGTFASLFDCHKKIGNKPDELVMALIQDLAHYCGSPRKLELMTDEEVWSYLESFQEEYLNEVSRLEEFCLS